MADSYIDPGGGLVVPLSVLELSRAKALAEVLESRRLKFVTYVECRRDIAEGAGKTTETVVFDVEVERPQRRQHDIRRIERIAVIFTAKDDWYPEVLALRADFPSVPHINSRLQEFPRSLCLYDESWDQVALRWTPTALVERIRAWLAETAKGTLHQEDQPLEPLLIGSGYRIILPSDLFTSGIGADHEALNVFLVGDTKDSQLLAAVRQVPGQTAQGIRFLAYPFVAKPQAAGVIRHTPRNLKDLHDFLLPCGVDLLQNLREKVCTWYDKKELKEKSLVLILAFPRVRERHQTIETTDLWVFLTLSTIQEIGVALGVLGKVSNDVGYGQIVGSKPDPNADGSSVGVDVLSPLFDIDRKSAASASGYAPDEREVLAVGAGALGSQVVDLLVRAGFGKWTLIDEDILLPHNLARHAIRSAGVGYSKAQVLAFEIDEYFDESDKTKWIKADVLHPGDKQQQIDEAFKRVGLVLELAASIPVARHCAIDAPGTSRRVSLFLNPRGTELVLLAEDSERSIRLDCLEMQYYRALINVPALATHLLPAQGRVRYARSCRDVTAVIPNNLVSMFGAIGSKAIRQTVAGGNASIRLWRSDPESLSIQQVQLSPTPVVQQKLGAWKLIVDTAVLAQLHRARAEKLPNETGGVFIGTYDFVRKIVYVADTIPSPPDSKEWPTLYIRGSEGLFARVQQIGEITDSQLQYVGEWHSHPDHCSCKPSDDDLKVFTWLTENLGDEGKPALMAIVGQNEASAWFLGEMLRIGGWEMLPLAQSQQNCQTPSAKVAKRKKRNR